MAVSHAGQVDEPIRKNELSWFLGQRYGELICIARLRS